MIPICWKCCNKITQPDSDGMFEMLVGCKECDTIKSYDDAKNNCPLLKEWGYAVS